MTFASAITRQIVVGTKKVQIGTFVSSNAGTGGAIVTGLHIVDAFLIQHTGGSTVAAAPSVNDTFPNAPGTITIVTSSNAAGIWMAIGN